MGTNIRSKISKKNQYWISKHRYYELKHFCLQYNSWKREYSNIDGMVVVPLDIIRGIKSGDITDPTYEKSLKSLYYLNKIKMLEDISKKTDFVLGEYVLKGVINGLSYDVLKARLKIPCGRDTYYNLYRKFFWILDRERD